MFSPDELLARHGIPAHFTREHDAILLASPFALLDTPSPWTELQTECFDQALQRRFVRSAFSVTGTLPDAFTDALEACSTPHLTYRMTASALSTAPLNLLLTCAPNAHLALTLVLERNALFTVEVVGRITYRQTS